MKLFAIFLLLVVFTGCIQMNKTNENKTNYSQNNSEVATFAGGCFWCMEGAFESINGVYEVVSGYTGGTKENVTYAQVSTGTTGHFEAVQIIYDPTKVSYDHLLSFFWRQIDPTDGGGQFVDRGPQYKTAIFYHNEKQKQLAEKSKQNLSESGKFNKSIATEILPFKKFYKAEEYHQDYYKKRILEYKAYEQGSGRKDYLSKTWESK